MQLLSPGHNKKINFRLTPSKEYTDHKLFLFVWLIFYLYHCTCYATVLIRSFFSRHKTSHDCVSLRFKSEANNNKCWLPRLYVIKGLPVKIVVLFIFNQWSLIGRLIRHGYQVFSRVEPFLLWGPPYCMHLSLKF